MRQAKERNSKVSRSNLVANNPAYDRKYNLDNGMDKDAIAYAKNNTLYDARVSLNRIASKHEPFEPKKTEYLKVDKKQFDKDMKVWKQRSRTALAQDRLKKKGDAYVPKKSGKKMFEEFMRDMREATGEEKKRFDDADMRNIFNAAQHLSYEKWIWFVNDEYGSRI
jgi:hypothetical protein